MPKPLTRKQQNFVQVMIDNPNLSGTEVAQQVYNTITRKSAAVIASQNLRNNEIRSSLGLVNDIVEGTLAGTVKDWGQSDKPREREIAIDAAKFIHDKIHGRAKQSISTESKHVVVSIDLSGSIST